MKILVVVGHGDDETQGAGGAIAYHAAQGDEVWGIHFTDGVGSRYDSGTLDEWSAAAAERQLAANAAADELGFIWKVHGDLPDNQLDTIGEKECASWLSEQVKGYDPDIIYTNYYADLNVDHRLVYAAVRIVFRPIRGRKCSEIRCMEVPRATEWCRSSEPFNPNCYMEVTPALWRAKKEALKAYSMELTQPPDLASLELLEALAIRRGGESGVMMAEGFVSVRRLIT